MKIPAWIAASLTTVLFVLIATLLGHDSNLYLLILLAYDMLYKKFKRIEGDGNRRDTEED